MEDELRQQMVMQYSLKMNLNIYHQHTNASYKVRLMIFLKGIGQQYVTIFAKK